MQLQAAAKINLHLRVAPRDASGYHPLCSWMCRIALFDSLTIRATSSGCLEMTCDDPQLACDPKNLILRAAYALREEMMASDSNAAALGASIELQKRIPIGGGLGGGSSNAAHALLGLHHLWNSGLKFDHLSRVAASIGSDVPFFLHGPSSVCTGRGEIIKSVPAPRAKWCVLMLPGMHMSTPAVYRRFDEMNLGDAKAVAAQGEWQVADWKAWAELSAGPLLENLANDLEAPAFALSPPLAQLRAATEQSLGRIVRMSGSGSSLFTLFDDQAEANAAAAAVQDRHNIRATCVALAPPGEFDSSEFNRDA